MIVANTLTYAFWEHCVRSELTKVCLRRNTTCDVQTYDV